MSWGKGWGALATENRERHSLAQACNQALGRRSRELHQGHPPHSAMPPQSLPTLNHVTGSSSTKRFSLLVKAHNLVLETLGGWEEGIDGEDLTLEEACVGPLNRSQAAPQSERGLVILGKLGVLTPDRHLHRHLITKHLTSDLRISEPGRISGPASHAPFSEITPRSQMSSLMHR